jgi:hypothetical protein
MKHYAGIDVSLNSSSVCVVDESGKIVREVKVASEPVALIHCIKSLGVRVERIGLEAGPLSRGPAGVAPKALRPSISGDSSNYPGTVLCLPYAVFNQGRAKRRQRKRGRATWTS